MKKCNNKNNNMIVSKATSWESTAPNFAQYPIVANHMGMMISVGSTIVLNVANDPETNFLSEFQNHEGHIVGIVLSYSSQIDIECLLYQPLEATKNVSGAPDRILSGRSYGLNEIIKTKNKIRISVEQIFDIAFVFLTNDIDDDAINFNGIANAYLLRYQTDNGHYEPVQGHVKFPCESNDSMLRRSTTAKIWYGICRIQDALWKILNSESERQVSVVRVPLQIDEITLDYIYHRCGGSVEQRMLNVAGRLRCSTTPGLKRNTKRAKRQLTMMRFETEGQFTLLRNVIGDTCTIGNRRRRPKLETTDKLEFNNTINLILGKENNGIDELTFKQYIYHDSIDFLSDEYETNLVVRYNSYSYNNNGITNEVKDVSRNEYVMKMMSSTIEEVPNNNELMQQHVRVGQILTRGNATLLVIVSVTDRNAVLQYIQPDELAGNQVEESDLTLLYHQICEYNS